ncbi:MAG: TonB-dependent siderophore receptor [Verrucomicrobiales bacterium]|nr:TonB-dependent siderophore receptor [Verrucomicrobiales bacterium]
MKRKKVKQICSGNSAGHYLRGGLAVTALWAGGSAFGQEVEATPAPAPEPPTEPEPEAESLPATVVENTAPAPVQRVTPAPAPAPPQVPAPPAAPVVDSEPIITDTLYQADLLSSPKYTQPLLDTPQTVQVITGELIADQGATTLRDALRNVSGISIQAGEGGAPPGDNLSIRGFSARSDFFVDGIRDLGAYSRDPFNLEQVEVAKGPAGSISGRGSTGGSINLVSKSAQLDDFTNTDLSVGTDDLFRSTIDINRSIEGIEGSALRLNAMIHENNTPGRGPAHDSRWGIAGALAFGLDELSENRLHINFFHMKEDNLPDYGIPWTPTNITDPRLTPYIDSAPESVFDNFYGVVSRDFEDTEATMFTVRAEHDFSDEVTLRNQTRIGQTTRLSLVTPPRFDNLAFPATVRRSDRKDRDEVTSIVANQTDLMASFDTGEIHHDTVLGMEIIREEYDRYSRTSDPGVSTDYFNPNPYDPVPGTFFRDGTGDQFGKSDTFAAYAFDTLEVNNWLEVTGGIRYERFETNARGTDAAGNPTPHRNRVDHMVSGRAAVVVKPAENGSIYFGWGTSFNPSGEFVTLTEAGRNPATFDVEPERAEAFELGTKWDVFDERLSLIAALFRTDKTNVRDIDPGDPTVYTLTGAERVEGFELGAAGEVTPWWSVYASYTHLRGEVTNDFDEARIGRELGNTPENSFSLWNNFELENGFFFGGGPLFIDRRLNTTAGTREAPAYWTLDAMAGYNLNDNITFRVNGANLTDEVFIDRMSGGHFIPGAGRSVMFTTSIKF